MPASRFHDGLDGATHTVRIFPFGRELRVVDENDVTLAAWQPAAIRAAPEVDPDGVVVLTARGQPGVLLTDDPNALDVLRRAGVKLPGHKAWTPRLWIAVCIGLIGAVGFGVVALNLFPPWIAASIPVAWERRLGGPAEALVTSSAVRCTGEQGQAALDHLVGRLLTAGTIEMPVTLSVLDDRTVNAFTLPGGHVLLMRGLIDTVDDGPELAGVIAHELGHVAHRDSTTLLLRGMGLSMLAQMIGLGDVGGTAASGATNLMNLAYTRAAELAADDTAITLLTRAGLRADGLSRFFARLDHAAGTKQTDDRPRNDTGMPSLNWLSTHPPSAQRRERTARPETGEMPFTDAEWQAIRSMCARKQ